MEEESMLRSSLKGWRGQGSKAWACGIQETE